MSRQSNNAIIYRKLQPYGPIEDGTLVFEKRPYDLPEPRDGDVIIQTMYCALDIFLVRIPVTCLISALSNSRSCPYIIHSGFSLPFQAKRRRHRFKESLLSGRTIRVGHLPICRIHLYPCQPNPASLSPDCSPK